MFGVENKTRKIIFLFIVKVVKYDKKRLSLIDVFQQKTLLNEILVASLNVAAHSKCA